MIHRPEPFQYRRLPQPDPKLKELLDTAMTDVNDSMNAVYAALWKEMASKIDMSSWDEVNWFLRTYGVDIEMETPLDEPGREPGTTIRVVGQWKLRERQ